MLVVIHSSKPLEHSLLSYLHHSPCSDRCIARPILQVTRPGLKLAKARGR